MPKDSVRAVQHLYAMSDTVVIAGADRDMLRYTKYLRAGGPV